MNDTKRYNILRRALDAIEYRQARGTAGGLEYLLNRICDRLESLMMEWPS